MEYNCSKCQVHQCKYNNNIGINFTAVADCCARCKYYSADSNTCNKGLCVGPECSRFIPSYECVHGGEYAVYQHICPYPSQHSYVGITKQNPPSKRWGKNGSGYKSNHFFYEFIKDYGWDNFEHIIIAQGLKERYAVILEAELIRRYDLTNRAKGFNKNVDAYSSFNNKQGNSPTWVKNWCDELLKQQKID